MTALQLAIIAIETTEERNETIFGRDLLAKAQRVVDFFRIYEHHEVLDYINSHHIKTEDEFFELQHKILKDKK